MILLTNAIKIYINKLFLKAFYRKINKWLTVLIVFSIPYRNFLKINN